MNDHGLGQRSHFVSIVADFQVPTSLVGLELDSDYEDDTAESIVFVCYNEMNILAIPVRNHIDHRVVYILVENPDCGVPHLLQELKERVGASLKVSDDQELIPKMNLTNSFFMYRIYNGLLTLPQFFRFDIGTQHGGSLAHWVGDGRLESIVLKNASRGPAGDSNFVVEFDTKYYSVEKNSTYPEGSVAKLLWMDADVCVLCDAAASDLFLTEAHHINRNAGFLTFLPQDLQSWAHYWTIKSGTTVSLTAPKSVVAFMDGSRRVIPREMLLSARYETPGRARRRESMVKEVFINALQGFKDIRSCQIFKPSPFLSSLSFTRNEITSGNVACPDDDDDSLALSDSEDEESLSLSSPHECT